MLFKKKKVEIVEEDENQLGIMIEIWLSNNNKITEWCPLKLGSKIMAELTISNKELVELRLENRNCTITVNKKFIIQIIDTFMYKEDYEKLKQGE